MEEPQPMDYVLHSSDASASRSQTQQPQSAGCPSWRQDQTSNIPVTLPNPNPDSTPTNNFRISQQQQQQQPIPHPTYDPVHASSNAWYPHQNPPFQWPTSIGLPPHSGYHSRNPSSDFYSLGASGGASNQGPSSGPASGPHQPVPPTLPFPDHHAYGFSYAYRHPSIPRFPPAQPQYIPFSQERSIPPQSTPRGISLPALNPHASQLSSANPSQNTHTTQGSMSSSGESSPATPSGPSHSIDVALESPVSPTHRSGDESPSNNTASSRSQLPARLNPLPTNAPSPTTPPVFATSNNGEYRRQFTSRPRVPRPSAQNSDYDSEEELERIEDEQMRFMEQYGLGSGSASAAFHLADRGIRAHQLIRGQLSSKRVASKKALASLECVDISTLTENERTCVICYNEFGVENPEGVNEAPLRLPNCKHVFGDHCIKKWFEESDSCPYCRDKVPSEMMLPSTATLQAFLRASYSANAGRLTISGPRPVGRQGSSRPQDGESYSRLRDEELGLSPPRAWQTGERRSPPAEFSENRRRTRARHFRSPSGAGVGNNRPLPFGGQTAAASSQHSPGRERVNPPNFQQAWYPFTNDPRRSLTPLFARQFAGQPRSFHYHSTPANSNSHAEYGTMPYPPPESMMAYNRGMMPPTAPYYATEPGVAPGLYASSGSRPGPTPGWGHEQQPSPAQPPVLTGQPLPPMTGYEPSVHPRPYPNNNWQ